MKWILAGLGSAGASYEIGYTNAPQPTLLFVFMSLLGLALVPNGPDTRPPAVSGSDGLPDGYWQARNAWIEDGDVMDLVRMIDLVE